MYDQKKQEAMAIAHEAQLSDTREKQALSWLVKERLKKEERRESEFETFVEKVKNEVCGN